MQSFRSLANHFRTVKGDERHGYAEYYDLLFAPRRESTTKLLEIGIWAWNSVFAFEAYFHNAKIFGFDMKEYKHKTRGRIQTFVGNQESREDLQRFIDQYGSDFDIIVDDAGHRMNGQQISLGFLFKHVKPGGLYIIEDLQSSVMKRFTRHMRPTTLGFLELYLNQGDKIDYQVWKTPFMLPEELAYLGENISALMIIRTHIKPASMFGVLVKKEAPK